MQSFKNLSVWEKAHKLVLEVYRVTKEFPKEEIYGITSQMQRAAVSIAANIAEGACKKTDNDFARFLQISLGSASEVEYYVLLTKDLGYINDSKEEDLSQKVLEIKKMLASFIGKVRS